MLARGGHTGAVVGDLVIWTGMCSGATCVAGQSLEQFLGVISEFSCFILNLQVRLGRVWGFGLLSSLFFWWIFFFFFL